MSHNRGEGNGAAVFIGWQEGHGDIPSFPMFTITLPDHPRCGSSVCLETLIDLKIPVPDYPKKEEVHA